MICSRCATKNGNERYFCKNCGIKLQGRRRRRAWLITCPLPSPDFTAAALEQEYGAQPSLRSLAVPGGAAAVLTMGVFTALIETIKRVRAPFDAAGVAAFVETNPLDTAATWIYHNPTLSYMIAGVISLMIAGIFVEFWR